MMTKAKQPPGLIAEFVARYAKPLTRAERQIEHEVFGTAAGIVSYTTPAQADVLAEALGLDAGTLLLDVGAAHRSTDVHIHAAVIHTWRAAAALRFYAN